MEDRLFQASIDGNVDEVIQLLKSDGININVKNITIHVHLIAFHYSYLTIFPLSIVYGIEFQYLTGLL